MRNLLGIKDKIYIYPHSL